MPDSIEREWLKLIIKNQIKKEVPYEAFAKKVREMWNEGIYYYKRSGDAEENKENEKREKSPKTKKGT